jgi:hypothetical protein
MGEQRHDSGAHHQPGQTSGQRGRGDLRHIDPRDIGGGGAQNFQRRDRLPPGLQIGRRAAADAQTRDHQRGQPHQIEEIAHAADEILGARRGIVAGADVDARAGELRLQPVGNGLSVAALRAGHAGAGAHHRSGRVQPGAMREARVGDDRGAQRKAFRQAVGLVIDDAQRDQALPGDGEMLARRDAQPLRRAIGEPRAPHRRRADQPPADQLEPTDQRPVLVHGLQLDGGGGVAEAGHGLHPAALRQPAVTPQRRAFLRRERALPKRELHVAAQSLAALGGKVMVDGGGQRAGGGQRPHAQKQAGQQQPQAPETRRKIAPRQPPCHRP